MRKTILRLFLLAALMLGSSSLAQAQFQLGPRLGIHVSSNFVGDDFFDEDLLNIDTAVQLGGEARFGLSDVADLPLVVNAVADFYLIGCDDEAGVEVSCTFLSLKGNALYELGVDNEVFTPYAGVGLALGVARYEVSGFGISISDTKTKIGLNALAGARLESGMLQPFAQLEAGLGGPAIFSVVGGVLFVF